MKYFITWKRLKQQFWLSIANLPMPGHGVRPFFVKMGGVKIQDWRNTYIGKNVSFDGVTPEMTIIEKGVRITEGTCILTHFINPKTGSFDHDIVLIKKEAFIGTGTIITKPVTIGERAIVGAGSIVTKNIPDDEVWAGNPARFIRKR